MTKNPTAEDVASNPDLAGLHAILQEDLTPECESCWHVHSLGMPGSDPQRDAGSNAWRYARGRGVFTCCATCISCCGVHLTRAYCGMVKEATTLLNHGISSLIYNTSQSTVPQGTWKRSIQAGASGDEQVSDTFPELGRVNMLLRTMVFALHICANMSSKTASAWVLLHNCAWPSRQIPHGTDDAANAHSHQEGSCDCGSSTPQSSCTPTG